MPHAFLTSLTEVNLSLIRKLQKHNYQTTVLVKDEREENAATTASASFIRGNIASPETYISAIKAADVVFHTPDIMNLQLAPAEGVVVESISKALENSQKTFVHTSHTWVLGNANNLTANEHTPVAPIALVAPLAHFEKSVLKNVDKGFKTIVVRAANVYGYQGDFVEAYIKRAVREKATHFAGNGYNNISTVALEDLLELYLKILEKGTAGSIYHAANGKPITSKGFAQLIGKTIGVDSTLGLNHAELKINYGVLAEAYALNQRIAFSHTKSELDWEPKHLSITNYINATERRLRANLQRAS